MVFITRIITFLLSCTFLSVFASIVPRATSGQATFYQPGLGTCGKVNSASDFVVSLAPNQWSSGAHCGKSVSVTYQGKSVTVVVEDECVACPSNGIDLSTAAFKALAGTLANGLIQVQWSFL